MNSRQAWRTRWIITAVLSMFWSSVRPSTSMSFSRWLHMNPRTSWTPGWTIWLTACPDKETLFFYHAVNLTDIMALCPFQQLIIPWDIVQKWSMYFRAQVSCDTYSNYLMLAWDIGRALPGSFWWSLAAWPGGWAAEGYWTGLVTSVSLGPQPYDKPLPKYDQSWSDPPH